MSNLVMSQGVTGRAARVWSFRDEITFTYLVRDQNTQSYGESETRFVRCSVEVWAAGFLIGHASRADMIMEDIGDDERIEELIADAIDDANTGVIRMFDGVPIVKR